MLFQPACQVCEILRCWLSAFIVLAREIDI
jgi:hypothetical protein